MKPRPNLGFAVDDGLRPAAGGGYDIVPIDYRRRQGDGV